MTQTGHWKTVSIVLGGVALCFVLTWGGIYFKDYLIAPEITATLPSGVPGASAAPTLHPLVELLKLVVAAIVGMVITAVHGRCQREKPIPRSLEHAQVMLCISGALMMIIIGNSLARAFGVAGAAGIVRFRTPVEDAKDATVIFLLLGLGMACGQGMFGVAGLGGLFLCVFLWLIDHYGESIPRSLMLAMTAEGAFPSTHVQSVLARHKVRVEPREVSPAGVKYLVTLDTRTSLEGISAELMAGGASGLKSVSWESLKKGQS